MKTKLFAPPWVSTELTEELKEAVEIISQDVWKEASVRFSAEREVKLRSGKSAPKGMQRYLNEVLVERFSAKGWDGDAGYFFKNKTWIRVTFRHQMSLGADILDALKVCKIEGMEIAAILAANRNTLAIVSPNDASALVSFEKLQSEVLSLNGALDIPLLIGELTPLTSASTAINAELKKERPRDVSVPQKA
jgi:hypothetical protein